MRRIFPCLLTILVLLFTGCSDNGVIPTLMGKFNEDYSYEIPQGWREVTDTDTLSLIMAGMMAEEYVVEHTLMGEGEAYFIDKAAIQILCDRGGPYSLSEIEQQYVDYLSRRTVNEPVKASKKLNLDNASFRIEETGKENRTILQRFYTAKGYVAVLATCDVGNDYALFEINSFIDGIQINPNIAYQ